MLKTPSCRFCKWIMCCFPQQHMNAVTHSFLLRSNNNILAQKCQLIPSLGRILQNENILQNCPQKGLYSCYKGQTITNKLPIFIILKIIFKSYNTCLLFYFSNNNSVTQIKQEVQPRIPILNSLIYFIFQTQQVRTGINACAQQGSS